MTRLNWQESYRINIDVIDVQHQKILQLVNGLEAAAANRNRDEVGRLLNELVSTIISHFDFEEELMAASGYGYLKAHKKLHDRFIERLVNFSQRFDKGECIIEEFHPFLVDWFRHHIEEDKDYGLKAAAEMNASAQKQQGWFSRTFGKGS